MFALESLRQMPRKAAERRLSATREGSTSPIRDLLSAYALGCMKQRVPPSRALGDERTCC